MSEKDTTASSLPEASDPDTAVETTEEALESRGQLGRDYLWNTAASLMSSLAVVIMGVRKGRGHGVLLAHAPASSVASGPGSFGPKTMWKGSWVTRSSGSGMRM